MVLSPQQHEQSSVAEEGGWGGRVPAIAMSPIPSITLRRPKPKPTVARPKQVSRQILPDNKSYSATAEVMSTTHPVLPPTPCQRRCSKLPR